MANMIKATTYSNHFLFTNRCVIETQADSEKHASLSLQPFYLILHI